MAIFVIMDRNKINIQDSIKDVRGCYKLGDIVEVFDDTTPCILPPAEPFYIIKVTGLSKADALKYTESEYDITDPSKSVPVRRRLYSIPIDLLPKAVKTKLQKDRYYEIDWKTVSSFITNKRTLDNAAGEERSR